MIWIFLFVGLSVCVGALNEAIVFVVLVKVASALMA